MRFELKLAWTYFRARRKSLARFTAAVAIIGIAAGVASLILAQALARGFQNEMRDKILANTAHITVFRKDGLPVKDYQQFIIDLAKIENVRTISPTTYESAILLGPKTSSYAVLRVVESRESRVESRFGEQQGATDGRPIDVKVGAELAEKAGLQIGETAEILVTDGETAKNSTVRVTGAFRTGLFDYDSSWIHLSPADHARLFNRQRFHPTVLSISVGDIYRTENTADQVRRQLSEDFRVVDWQEANRPLFAALGLEKKVSLAIISLIIFIAVLNITTTLALLVNERKFDIAILRTCGARTQSLLLIFLLEGLYLGASGIGGGIGLGLSLSLAANHFRLVSLDASVYSVDHILLNPAFSDLLLIVAITFFLSILATAYPAWRAARIKPLENLRRF